MRLRGCLVAKVEQTSSLGVLPATNAGVGRGVSAVGAAFSRITGTSSGGAGGTIPDAPSAVGGSSGGGGGGGSKAAGKSPFEKDLEALDSANKRAIASDQANRISTSRNSQSNS